MIIDEKYRDLLDYVNSKTDEYSLAEVLANATKESMIGYKTDSKLWRIIERLYTTPLTDDEITDLVKTIIDIYTGNCEIKENKYNWRFLPLKNGDGGNMYLYKSYDGPSLDSYKGQFTQSEFDDFIEHNNYLTAEMFEREDLEED